MDNKYSNTIITSSDVTSRLIDGRRVTAEELIVNNQSIVDISHDLSDNSSNKVPSSYTLDQLSKKFDKDVTAFKNELNDTRITPVISEAITSPYFDGESKWASTNFTFQYGRAIYRNTNGDTGEQARLQLRNEVFLWTGTYFVVLSIENMPDNATLHLLDSSGDEIATFITPGKHMLSIDVKDINNYTLSLTMTGVKVDDLCIIDRVYIYYVQSRAMDYFRYMGENILSGGGGTLATTAWVQQKLNDTSSSCNTYASGVASQVDSKLTIHMSSKNGHGTVPSDIGAADAVHTHLPEACGAAPKDHVHTPVSIGAADREHTHTPVQCGAADKDHGHAPASIGAADAAHIHEFSTIAGSDVVLTHINYKGNAHDMVKGNITLGNVENYGIAEVVDYTTGSTDKYATSGGVVDYLDEVFGADPTKKYIPLAPKQILNTTITLDDAQEFTIQLRRNTVYEIYLSCRATINAGYIGAYIPEVVAYTAAGTGYMNSWEYCKTKDGENLVTWAADQTNMCYLTPKNIGNNIVKGKLVIDTTVFNMYGEYQSWIGKMDEDNRVKFLTNTSYPIKSKCTVKELPTFATDYVSLTFRHNKSRNTTVSTGPVTTDIIIHEYVNIGTEASVYDRSPLLSRVEFIGTTPPLGWDIEAGRELIRNDYQELAAFIIKYNASVTLSEYNASITNTGKCTKFALTDTMIKLPTNPFTSTDSIRIIKIKR